MRLQTKINIIFSSIVVILALVLSYFIYTSSTKLITNSLGEKVRDMARVVAANINLGELQNVADRTIAMKNQKEEVNEILVMDEYRKLRETLWEFKRVYGLKFIYIMAKSKHGETIYIVDGFSLNYTGSDVSKPGDVEANTYELLESTFNEKETFIGELSYDEEWGGKCRFLCTSFERKGRFNWSIRY